MGSGIIFREATISELEGCLPLLEAHWREVALYQDKIQLEPDFDRALTMAEMGLAKVYFAETDSVVGYQLYFLSNHIHYKSSLWAHQDLIYVDPSYRGEWTDDFVLYAENSLKDLGVEVITLHMKTYKPFDNLAKRLGYDNIERIYAKYIR